MYFILLRTVCEHKPLLWRIDASGTMATVLEKNQGLQDNVLKGSESESESRCVVIHPRRLEFTWRAQCVCWSLMVFVCTRVWWCAIGDGSFSYPASSGFLLVHQEQHCPCPALCARHLLGNKKQWVGLRTGQELSGTWVLIVKNGPNELQANCQYKEIAVGALLSQVLPRLSLLLMFLSVFCAREKVSFPVWSNWCC